MTKQIMKLTIPYDSTWKIVMDDSEQYNKFKVIRMWREQTDYGVRKRTKTITKYATIASCLIFITHQLTGQ